MDQYQSIRSLPFPALASALGLDLQRYKTRKGGEYYGACPIHGPKNNSTSFSYAADGKFNCFSCGAKGRGGIDLAKLVKNVGFQAAVDMLGSIPPPQQKEPRNEAPVSDNGELKPLAKDTWRKFAVACPWLEERIPDADIREKYGVFCYNNPARKSAYSGRVMLPVKCPQGHLYGYLGRIVPTGDSTEQPKYLFPKGLEKSRFLFGADVLTSGMFGQVPLKRVYLVESPFCVMKFASMGLPAVAAYGWSVSEEQVQLLQPIGKGIVYLPDRNKFEDSNASLGLLAKTFWVRRPELPAGIGDPEQMSLEMIHSLTK